MLHIFYNSNTAIFISEKDGLGISVLDITSFKVKSAHDIDVENLLNIYDINDLFERKTNCTDIVKVLRSNGLLNTNDSTEYHQLDGEWEQSEMELNTLVVGYLIRGLDNDDEISINNNKVTIHYSILESDYSKEATTINYNDVKAMVSDGKEALIINQCDLSSLYVKI